jgi:hypothetical protein
MPVKFYNPGPKIKETLRFDHPTNDPKYQNNVSYWDMVAPEKDFFDIPTIIEFQTVEGQMVSVPVYFAGRVKEDYKTYGFIKIDPKYVETAETEGDNVAADEKKAKIKGDLRYQDYMLDKAREWILNVERIRAAGGVPNRAGGVFAHALKAVGMADPADPAGNAMANTSQDEKIARLEKAIEELTKVKK